MDLMLVEKMGAEFRVRGRGNRVLRKTGERWKRKCSVDNGVSITGEERNEAPLFEVSRFLKRL